MITIFMKHSLNNIKNKLLALYILNVTDIVLTLLLTSTGFFIEANPLMSKVIQSPSATITLKIGVPAVLLIVVFARMQKATDHQLRISNNLICIVLLLYSLINLSHIVWFTFYTYKT